MSFVRKLRSINPVSTTECNESTTDCHALNQKSDEQLEAKSTASFNDRFGFHESLLPPDINPEALEIVQIKPGEVFARFPGVVTIPVVTSFHVGANGYKTERIHPVAKDFQNVIASQLESATFYKIQKENGQIQITYCKHGPIKGEPCSWFTSKYACLEEAAHKWGYLSTDKYAQIYEFNTLEDQHALPSDGPKFIDALNIALKERMINSLENPILASLGIGQPKRTSKKVKVRRISANAIKESDSNE